MDADLQKVNDKYDTDIATAKQTLDSAQQAYDTIVAEKQAKIDAVKTYWTAVGQQTEINNIVANPPTI